MNCWNGVDKSTDWPKDFLAFDKRLKVDQLCLQLVSAKGFELRNCLFSLSNTLHGGGHNKGGNRYAVNYLTSNLLELNKFIS